MYICDTTVSGTGSNYPAAGGANDTPLAGTIDNKIGNREIQLAAKYYF
jgi:hypothetical protein